MEIETITTSHSQKLNNALYGGGQYEMSDHFVSLTASVEVGEDVKEAHRQLTAACKEMVQEDIENTIMSFSGGLTAEKFYNYLRDLVARRPVDADTYQACNTRQKAILQAAKRGLQMGKRDNQKENV